MLAALVLPIVGAQAEEKISFNRDIRPILSDKCFHCLDAELRLVKADAIADVDNAEWMAKNVAIVKSVFTADAASMLYVDGKGNRWRLPRGDAALDAPGPPGPERVCREVCTGRNLLNIGGTFYELPADNAGGFIKLRPVTTHNRRIHDFASYRGLLVLSGLTADAKGEHIVRSEDGKCALWLGTVDDLWGFGKARGTGGPWRETAVKAGVASDPYLATGYDQKRLTLRHTATAPVTFRVEADFTGDGTWTAAATSAHGIVTGSSTPFLPAKPGAELCSE